MTNTEREREEIVHTAGRVKPEAIHTHTFITCIPFSQKLCWQFISVLSQTRVELLYPGAFSSLFQHIHTTRTPDSFQTQPLLSTRSQCVGWRCTANIDIFSSFLLKIDLKKQNCVWSPHLFLEYICSIKYFHFRRSFSLLRLAILFYTKY